MTDTAAKCARHGGRAQPLAEPGARRQRIGARLLRREGLGADDEQCARRIGAGQRIDELRAIDIGDEGNARRTGRESAQRLDRHRGPQVGTADADVHDQLEGLPRRTAHRARAHALGEMQHAGALTQHLRHHVGAFDPHRFARHPAPAQRRMQHRPPLGEVDEFAVKHRRDALAQSELVGQLANSRRTVASTRWRE